MKKDNIYIGMRYVPRFMGVFNPSSEYEPLSLVKQEEDSSVIYISIIPVPSGTSLTDTTYWQSYTASADTSGLVAELAALTTKVNANEGAITELTTTVQENTASIRGVTTTANNNTASIQTVTTRANNNTNRIIALESSTANIQPIKPIRWFVDGGTSAQLINRIPVPPNYSSTIIGEDAYSAYPSLFDTYPYITRITWTDSNNRNAQIIDNTPHIVSKTNPDIQINLDNQKPEAGFFFFHLNKTQTASYGQDSCDLIIPQMPTLEVGYGSAMQVNYNDAVFLGCLPKLPTGPATIYIAGLKNHLRHYSLLDFTDVSLHLDGAPGTSYNLQLTNERQTVNINASKATTLASFLCTWSGHKYIFNVPLGVIL